MPVVNRAALAAVPALVVGLLAGCGAGASTSVPDDDMNEARAVFDGYGAALGERDFAVACNSLTQRARAQVVEAVTLGRSTAGVTCERAFQAMYGQAQLAQVLDAERAAVFAIAMTGTGTREDQVLISYRNSSGEHTARLVREGGTWHIDAAG